MDENEMEVNPKKSWNMWRQTLLSGALGGLYLWILSLNTPGKGVYLALVAFFFTIPVLMILSAITFSIVIYPMAYIIERIKFYNPISVVSVSSVVAILVLTISPDLFGMLKESAERWHIVSWVALMAFVSTLQNQHYWSWSVTRKK